MCEEFDIFGDYKKKDSGANFGAVQACDAASSSSSSSSSLVEDEKKEAEPITYRCKTETGEIVFVPIAELGAFFNDHPDGSVIEDEPVTTSASPPKHTDYVPTGKDDDDDGLADASAGDDRSRYVHFSDITRSGGAKNRVDPTNFESATKTGRIKRELVGDGLPGKITAVRFMYPSNPSDHFELICIATKESSSSSSSSFSSSSGEVAIKFDFTRDGYRMIYGADPDGNNGNRTTRGDTAPRLGLTVDEATHDYVEIAVEAGVYDDGRNECGTFARSLYKLLTGRDAPD